MKRFLAVFLVAALCVTSLMTTGVSAATVSRETKAQAMFQMGLFQGYDTSGTNFGLVDPVTREQALTFLIRMLGEESQSKAWIGSAPYQDVPDGNWAKPYIGDAKAKGYTKGMGDNMFGLGTDASMKQMTIFALRGLGYSDAENVKDFDWDSALTFAKSKGILTSDQEINPFTRGVAVDIIYASLFATVKGQNYNLITKLIKDGAVTQAQYDKGMAIVNGTTATTKNNPPSEGNYTMKCMDNYIYVSSDKLELRDTTPAQFFEIDNKSDYSYIKTESGKYLTATNVKDGQQLSISSSSFAWVIEKQSGSKYTIRPYEKTTLAVSATNEKSSNGTKMILEEHSSADKSTLITMSEVSTKAVTGVELDKSTANITVGKTLSLTATISPSSATNKNVTWSSDNTGIAKVDSKGVVTAVKEGTTTITVKTTDGSKKATCKVTVVAAVAEVPVTGVSLQSGSATVESGKTVSLTASVAPSNATNKNVTWNSNDTAIAKVDANGVVTGVSAGNAIITVTTNNGKTATCTVTVTAPAPAPDVADQAAVDRVKSRINSLSTELSKYATLTGAESLISDANGKLSDVNSTISKSSSYTKAQITDCANKLDSVDAIVSQLSKLKQEQEAKDKEVVPPPPPTTPSEK